MPSHVLYADILVFCRASKNSLLNLLNLFKEYESASGQVISKEKSKFYSGSISSSRSESISSILGFNAGCLPFIYLGVPLFKGKPKKVHLVPIVDRIKNKHTSWKGSLLSLMGRVLLVQSVIHGMLIYSFKIYAWPASLIKMIDG